VRRSQQQQQRQLLLTMALAILAGILAATVDLAAVRIGAGVVLELVLTGYAIASLLSTRARFTRSEMWLCALGASLVVSALGGLLLDVLPGHMGRSEWALMLTLVTLLACAVALWMVRGATGSRGAPTPMGGLAALLSGRSVLRTALDAACALLAVGLAGAAIVLASGAAKRAPGFTELSSLPLSSAHDPRLQVRVRSHEARATALRLVVREDGHQVLSREIPLGAGREWRGRTAPVAPSTHRVLVLLYRGAAKRSYLHTSFYPPIPRAPAPAQKALRKAHLTPARLARILRHRSGYALGVRRSAP
jgi:hypothetical protein